MFQILKGIIGPDADIAAALFTKFQILKGIIGLHPNCHSADAAPEFQILKGIIGPALASRRKWRVCSFKS